MPRCSHHPVQYCSLTNSSYFSRDESLREPVATFIVVRCERTMVFFPGRVRERASSQPNPFTRLSTLATLSRRGERAVSRQAQALPRLRPETVSNAEARAESKGAKILRAFGSPLTMKIREALWSAVACYRFCSGHASWTSGLQ